MNRASHISNLLPTGHCAPGRRMGFGMGTQVTAMSSPAQADDVTTK